MDGLSTSRFLPEEKLQTRRPRKRTSASCDNNIDNGNGNGDSDNYTGGSDGSTSENHRTKRARLVTPASIPAHLTRKNLARLDEMARAGKQEKSGKNQRVAARLAILEESTADSSSSLSTKALSTTAPGFALQARDNGILDATGSRPPSNLAELRQLLAQPRASASPPESAYDEYAHAIQNTENEATVLFVTTPLLRTYPVQPYKTVLNQAWTAFPRDAGFNNGLSAPQPDFVQGLEMEAYRPLPVNKLVHGAVLYKDNPRSVTLPHIAGEWKGPGGDMREAALQTSYDGAAMVYARNQALAYHDQTDAPGHAAVSTFATDGSQVTFYAHYAAPRDNIHGHDGRDVEIEYHQYPIRSTSLVNSHDEYKAGRRALRNLQDHARDQSYALKDQLQAHHKQETRKMSGLGVALPMPNAEIQDADPVDTVDPDHGQRSLDDDDTEIAQPQELHEVGFSLPASLSTKGRKRKASLSHGSYGSRGSSSGVSRHQHEHDRASARVKVDETIPYEYGEDNAEVFYGYSKDNVEVSDEYDEDDVEVSDEYDEDDVEVKVEVSDEYSEDDVEVFHEYGENDVEVLHEYGEDNVEVYDNLVIAPEGVGDFRP
ncbi:hypothetical protein SEUCBS139899_000164 [Sporothrix eucalyptigena]|uniref:DUF7924 domain-containing protein n=1 Tax=Sporothrix eucalyptigena TaxID=1812306 RepID=A0ABP0C6X6_9PEZI